MLKTMVAGVVGVGVGIAALTGVALSVDGTGPDATATFYGGEYSVDETSMLQSDFPCEEDEALMYSPAFGPDNVGCVHLDSL